MYMYYNNYYYYFFFISAPFEDQVDENRRSVVDMIDSRKSNFTILLTGTASDIPLAVKLDP